MAEQKTQTESAAVAPGLVPGDVTDTKDASAHIDDYCSQVEDELKKLEDGISQIRSATKQVKGKRQAGLLDDLRNLISEVMHSVPMLRASQGPRAHVEHRTLAAPDVNDPNTVSATGGQPIL